MKEAYGSENKARTYRWVQDHGSDRDVAEFGAVSMALSLAIEAHRPHTVEGVDPYIWYPISVARRLYEQRAGFQAECVALLQGTLEEHRLTHWVINDTLGPVIAEAVYALTQWVHRGWSQPGWKPYLEYILVGVCPNDLARTVKRAELTLCQETAPTAKHQMALELLDEYEAKYTQS